MTNTDPTLSREVAIEPKQTALLFIDVQNFAANRKGAEFKDVPAETPWVELAEKELEKTNAKPGERNWDTLRAALERIQQLRDEKKTEEANRLQQAMEQLYQGDEAALKLIGTVK